MDSFNIVAGVCSILGLIVGIISLFLISHCIININNNGGNGNIIKSDNVTIYQSGINYANEPIKKPSNLRSSSDKKIDNFNDTKSEPLSESRSFTLINDEGQKVTCDVLFTFESEETHKNYIVYTDNTEDDEGNVQVYASVYNPNATTSSLQPIETDYEWRIIEAILDELQKAIKEGIHDQKRISKRIDKRIDSVK